MSTTDSPRVVDWYRCKVDPKLLAELNERSDWKGFLQAGGHFGLWLLTGGFSYYAWLESQWVILAILLYAHGTIASFGINAVHEAVHGTVFKTKWMNTATALLFAFQHWGNPYHFWATHTEHHKYTLHTPDDIEVQLPWKLTLDQFLKAIFLLPWHLTTPFDQVRQGISLEHWNHNPKAFPEGKEKQRDEAFLWQRFVICAHLAIIVASIATGQWIIPFIVSFSHLYTSWLNALCNTTQHSGLVDNVRDFRLCCRTVYLDPITQFLYWHMNYHIEHHMYAAVPCYNLHKLHKAIKHELPPTANGLYEAWAEISFIQRRQKYDPTYQYRQPLPEDNFADRNRTAISEQPLSEAKESVAVSSSKSSSTDSKSEDDRPFKRWECTACAFIYDEEQGWPEEGIEPGTRWEDIPEDWSCPDCGVSKEDFDMVELNLA